ncbi:MAG: glucose-phosphate cytidylyltransferase [Acidimicrobiales bacterium]|jgi:glucose-1-phosphate cytidylyltransferase|nr:glucose-phosphate cytidylyltransferase [Acidimicrobiales bacterium]
MQAAILCGGKGTRAWPYTAEVPKPLLQVAGKPVLLHVLELYAAQGVHDFVLAAGFKHELISEFARTLPDDWKVNVVDTGEETNTGERLVLVRELLEDTFFATYADGLGNVDLVSLLEFHRDHAGAASVTTVPLPSQYGTLLCDDDGRVERFLEKPVLRDHWINAGFFVLDQRAFQLWSGDDLERTVLPGLSAVGELFAYRHDGFWKSMDTYKDALELTALCGDGTAPWLRSAAGASS